jgi:hypothetical protein
VALPPDFNLIQQLLLLRRRVLSMGFEGGLSLIVLVCGRFVRAIDGLLQFLEEGARICAYGSRHPYKEMIVLEVDSVRRRPEMAKPDC